MPAEPALRRRDEDGAALYSQVADWIIAHIRAHGLRPGDILPSQSDLMRRLGVSQATVRHALHRLTKEGVIVARQGKGLFVAEPRLQLRIDEPEVLRTSVGSLPGLEATVIESIILTPSPSLLDRLRLPPGSQVARVRRRFTRGGVVIGMEARNFPLPVLGRIGNAFRSDGAFITCLADHPETAVHRVRSAIRAETVSDFDATLLGVGPGRIVLHQLLTLFNRADEPVAAGRTTFLADAADIAFDITVPPA